MNSKSQPQTKLECILDEWLRRVGKADDFEETYLQSCSVIAGTCVGIAGVKHLPDGYDWVIIDEAGRATPAELLIPLVRGRRSILVGDHRQLPPVIEYNLHRRAQKRDDIDPTWLEQSLFEYLFVRLPNELKSTLRTQYRMHPAIANLISDVFYREEGLETGIQQEERTHQWKRWDTAVVWFSTSAIEKRFESVDQNSSKLNQCEAELITSQLADLEDTLRDAGAKKKVGVIAGYSAQIQLLERKLDPSDSDRWQAVEIEVNTVDAFQGRERDIIFYSVVRSNRKHEIGFLKDARRLNVALSRARDMLFVVGDHRMLAEANVPIGGNPFVDVLRHILSHPAECTLKEASL